MLADLPPLPVFADFAPPAVTMQLAYTSRKSLRFEGLHASVQLNEPGSFTVIVRDPGQRQISGGKAANATVTAPGGGATVNVFFGQAAKKQLRAGKKIRWTVVAEAVDGTGNKAVHNAKLWIG